MRTLQLSHKIDSNKQGFLKRGVMSQIKTEFITDAGQFDIACVQETLRKPNNDGLKKNTKAHVEVSWESNFSMFSLTMNGHMTHMMNSVVHKCQR